MALGLALALVGLPAVAQSAPSPPPPNDDLGDAEQLDGYPVRAAGTTDGATRELGEPRPCGQMEATIWFSWTSPVTGAVQVDSRGSQFDADIAVYQGTGFDDLALVGCDSDAYWMQARVAFEAVAGERYLVQLGCNCGAGNTAAVSIGPEEDFGRLAGTVTDEDGVPIAGACVNVSSEDGMAGIALGTDADGRWQIEVGPARYYLKFFDCAERGRYRSEWWDDQPTWETADLVTVAPGETADLPVALEAGGDVDVAVEHMRLRRASPQELLEDQRPWRVVVVIAHLAGMEPEPAELLAWARPASRGEVRRFAQTNLVLDPGTTVEVVLPWDGSRIVGDADVSVFLHSSSDPDLDPGNNELHQRMTITGVPLGAGIRPA